ncbi:flavin-binding monooxygenase-like protein [Aspergillus sclerotiicarbonarius CBS 121057]|uniref:Flavin-binding monooxygenase-like protein n=1 Tax=Aspergillus sclerotiicarbonarius (strain CBS 121057 / IBT 28362) TaxID=1448318 RepID=A0A319DYS2_ASPSB|nr:flavin-binding monooxygenase-like protein [Aspergillus sclerotiicarbonarius CBS 121057]
MESFDVIVVGAGWHGLAALKTYHQVHPNATILLIDSASSIGGVWATHCLYDGLKSNNMLGTYEFSDFPMDPATYGVQPGQHIPGKVIQTYLQRFVKHFQLTDLIRLHTTVQTADHQSDGSWILTATSSSTSPSPTQQIHTSKLILATGMTSQPYLPPIPGSDLYPHPILHTRDLLPHQPTLFHPTNRITIYGGTKSAWDAVYSATTSGASVTWVIRSSGHGPCWMAPPYVTPLKRWLEKLVTTRLLTWFSPCIWGHADGYNLIRTFLHGTWLGRKLVDIFWSILEQDVTQLNNYASHPETSKLKPWISPFWVASGLSILNYPTDFFTLVRSGKIRILIDEITSLDSTGGIHLKNSGEILPSDALICATGWKVTPNMQFTPAGIDKELGFPWAEDSIPGSMVSAADEEILTRFPKLREAPTKKPEYMPLGEDAPATARHPFRLARFMVPPALARERSVAVVGVAMTINTALVAQVQALWVAAYLGDKMALKSGEVCPESLVEEVVGKREGEVDADVVWETALHTQFGVHRYPGGFGSRNPDFVFDALAYVDLLLRDLGLDYSRKKGVLGWLRAYGMEDYRGLVEEWIG